MGILDVASWAVLAFVGVRLVGVARHTVRSRAHVLRLWRGVRPRHFLLAVPVFVVILSVALVLLQVPGLDFGWWSMLGGEGNPVFGAASEDSVGPLDVVIPICFALLLLIGLPLLVEGEEWVFRRGAEERTRAGNLKRSCLFGIVHAAIGIPIGVAMALSVGGVYFTWAYLREFRRTGSPTAALRESTRAHLAYNVSIVSLVLVSLVFGV